MHLNEFADPKTYDLIAVDVEERIWHFGWMDNDSAQTRGLTKQPANRRRELIARWQRDRIDRQLRRQCSLLR